MEEVDVCNSWEDIDPSVLEKHLERIHVEKQKRDRPEEAQRIKILTRQPERRNDIDCRVQLDDTSQESLRSQYVPPEPKISILSRPKASNSGANTQLNGHNSNKNKPVKTLQQREQEYAEARMRILGDVKFEDSDDCCEPAEPEQPEPPEQPEQPEEDASTYAGLTPAEILKQKIAQVLLEDNSSSSAGASPEASSLPSGKSNANTNSPASSATPAPKASKKSKREKIKTINPEPTRDFPVSKTDLERIIRQPRGPDGTSGFNFQR